MEYDAHQCLKLKPGKYRSNCKGRFNMRPHTALYIRPQSQNCIARFFKNRQNLKILTNKLNFLHLCDLFPMAFYITLSSFNRAALRNLAKNRLSRMRYKCLVCVTLWYILTCTRSSECHFLAKDSLYSISAHLCCTMLVLLYTSTAPL